MKWVLALLGIGLLMAPLHSFGQAKKKVRKPTVTAKSTNHGKATSAPSKTAGRSAGTRKVAIRSGKGRHKAGGTMRAAAPAIQNHPDPERYQQIQQALSEQGYFKGEINGEWNSDSQDALTRFQADKKLEADGKITALTLRNLGLGPKHEGTPTALSGQSAAPSKTGEVPSLNAPPANPALAEQSGAAPVPNL